MFNKKIEFQLYFIVVQFCSNNNNVKCLVLFQPVDSAWPSITLSILRTVFIPLMLLCNANPRHNLPILINSDQCYTIIMSVFGFTNGIISNISMASIPQ